MLKGLFLSLRPHQWVKNLFVVAPLIFAKELFNEVLALKSGLAFLVFCLLTGAVYILNDLSDMERDRAHPIKKNRPIASGRLSPAVAASAAAAFVAGSLVAATFLGRSFAMVAAAYLVLNLAYSFRLKHVPYVDVLCIALGFLLRILAGSRAIDVPASLWLLMCTFLLALFLALGKRRQEMSSSGGSAPRPVLSLYNLRVVNWSMRISALLSLAAYTAYTLDSAVRSHFGTDLLPIGVPFVAVGLFRFDQIASRSSESGRSPTEAMLRDPILVLTILIWSALNVWVIY